MLEKIQSVLRDYKEDQSLEINESTTFDEVELDSIDKVEIVMSVEEVFGVNIELNEEIKTVGDLMKIIEAQQS